MTIMDWTGRAVGEAVGRTWSTITAVPIPSSTQKVGTGKKAPAGEWTHGAEHTRAAGSRLCLLGNNTKCGVWVSEWPAWRLRRLLLLELCKCFLGFLELFLEFTIGLLCVLE